MPEIYVEKVYDKVTTLLMNFGAYDPQDAIELLDDLQEIHAIPEIGEKLFDEEKDDLLRLISILENKTDLIAAEADLLLEAKSLLNEIECRIAYNAGESRTNAVHTIDFNFAYLRSLTDDEIYQNCLNLSEAKIKELFHYKHGVLSGSTIFHSALDVLVSFYYYAMLLEDLDNTTKDKITSTLYDIATNISSRACSYLAHKDAVFKLHKES